MTSGASASAVLSTRAPDEEAPGGWHDVTNESAQAETLRNDNDAVKNNENAVVSHEFFQVTSVTFKGFSPQQFPEL